MPSKSVEDNLQLRRFDLVKKMYVSDRMIAANKKDLIFNWFFENFGKFQDVKSSKTYKLLWETFYDILSTEKENCSTHKILIKSNAVINFLDAVTNYPYSDPWASVILSSITKFLQTPTVNAALIADIDTLIMLLTATLNIICKTYELNLGDVQSQNKAICLASAILDILETLPSSNEEDKALLLSNSLKDLAIFMYLAVSHKELESLSDKLVKKIISILFNLKSKHYETLLASVTTKDVREPPNSSLLQFFVSLQNLLKSEEVIFQSVSANLACASLMKKLLENFLLLNKSSLHSLKVTSVLFAIAGLDIPILMGSSSSCNSMLKEMCQNFDTSVLGICHLLEACSVVPQCFTRMSVPEGYYKPLIWLKGLAAALLGVKLSKNKSSWLKCFQLLLKTSPSILENDIVPFIKMAHLNISVHSAESKKQYCELFDTILRAHSLLHQMPKFFVDLLFALTQCIKENTGGKFLTNGQILPQVQESIARYVRELPYGQMIELWKIFIESLSTLGNMSQAFVSDKCYMFFVAQLFSTFLGNAQLFQENIPSNISSKFSGLIELTSKEIMKNISILKETDSKAVPLQRSLLLLCYVIGDVKLKYMIVYQKPVDMSEANLPELVFDFSVVHSFLNSDYAIVLESFLSGDDKILAALVFQLLLQKVKAASFSVKETDLKSLMFVIIHHLQTFCVTSTAPWDMDLCTINKMNYSTVIWKMLSKMMPLMLRLSPKSFTSLTHAVINVILQDNSSDDAKYFLLSSWKCEFYKESKQLQTSVASMLWNKEKILRCKKRSHDDSEVEESDVVKIFSLLYSCSPKSLKYAQRTPKSDTNLGDMWTQIKEICDILNNLLLSESLLKDKLNIDRTYDLLKLLKCLPLESTLPGNQMKFIIGLSLLFFLVPQSCESVQAENLAKEIALLLISIFEGVRSIWLFDFVTSGPYLKFIVKTLEAVFHARSGNNFDWAIQLVEHLISVIVKNTKPLEAAEQYISELSVKKKCNRSTLITFYALLKKLAQVHPQKQEKDKETLQRIFHVLCLSFVKFCKQLNFEDMENADHILFIKCYVHVIEIVCSFEVEADFKKECIDFLPVILGIATGKITDVNTDVLSDVHLLLISKICKHSSVVSSFLPKNFVRKFWNIFIPYFQEKAKRRLKSEVNGSSNFPAYNQSDALDNNTCLLCSPKKCYTFLENSEPTESVLNETMSPLSLNESEEESIRELCAITSDEELCEVFQDLLKQMGWPDSTALSISSFHVSLLLFKCIIDVIKEKCQQPLINQHLQKCLSYLYSLMHQSCNTPTCQVMIKIPIMDFISFILRGNKGLPNQLLLQSLQCVSSVQLDYDDDYDLYAKLFSAAWRIVYDLFMHHTAFVLTSCASFLVHVEKLLLSIVKAGRDETLIKCNPETFQKVQLCAQNMNRLLTVITRNKIEFAKLVPYLITDYVDTVKCITLEPTIKDTLLSGIHRILDICSDHAIKMLSINISYSGREVYANLIKNYQQNKYMGST